MIGQWFNKGLLLRGCALFFVFGSFYSSADTSSLKTLADKLEVKYQVISNVQNQDCKALFDGNCFAGRITFSLSETQTFSPFSLYFSHIAPIGWDNHPNLDIRHMNGDLHEILFSGEEFVTGKSVTIEFKAANWHASHTDVMPNYFVVSESAGPFIVESTKADIDAEDGTVVLRHLVPHQNEQQFKRFSGDHLPVADANWLYEHNHQLNAAKPQNTSQENRIIPKVNSQELTGGKLNIENGLNISWGDFAKSQTLIDLFSNAGIKIGQSGVSLTLQKLQGGGEEEYTINISNSEIKVSSAGERGIQYGLVTLYQMLKTQGLSLPLGKLNDGPRFSFRGVHADVSRNFLGKQPILNLIQQMYLLKLNKLHLHLADDEGWRLEIPELPELTEVGAYRCYDPEENRCLLPQLGSGPFRSAPTNGFLTTKEYKEILRFADDRKIEVIPSFDLPGHARAAVKSMEARYLRFKQQELTDKAEEFLLSDFEDDTEYLSIQFYQDNTVNPCQESTYRFIDTVIKSVKRLHEESDTELNTYHIGADETAGAWINSPVCQAFIDANDGIKTVKELKGYFLKRLVKIVADNGLHAAGWSDGMHHVIDSEAGNQHQANVWDTLFWQGHDIAREFSQKGWSTVLSHPDVLYFDFPYRNHPEEPGYYWGSKNTDTFKVFQFMPENLAANAAQWSDRMGQSYTAKTSSDTSFQFTGMQSQIWTESVRDVGTFQYLMYPRLQAFAERAWHKAEWELELTANTSFSLGEVDKKVRDLQLQDWYGFRLSLERYLDANLINGAQFRIPPPGVTREQGKLRFNTAWQGLKVQCRTKGSQWKIGKNINDLVAIQTPVECRAWHKGSGRYSRTVTLPAEKNVD